ncbi:hypothetical protein TcWFU_005246 [Taenia crassiceps]|uniref:Uncharacterized protein n=1 Tax=Taenia crassiceps TaxID=6207 RepID=A0ABR4Q0D4_9CEST
MISLKTLFLLTVCVCLAFSQEEEEGGEGGVGDAEEGGNDTDALNASDTLAAEDSVCGLRVSTPLIVGSLLFYKLLA